MGEPLAPNRVLCFLVSRLEPTKIRWPLIRRAGGYERGSDSYSNADTLPAVRNLLLVNV
jgi:hypothetical protein